MAAPDAPPIRFLGAEDVAAAMPPLAERLALAERTMTALVSDAELPAKIGVHPRPDGSFAHAMPAFLHGTDAAGRQDLLGLKWIAGFPANRERALPAIHGLVLLTDPGTGVPRAILDAGPITAERTAAISGVAIRQFAPAPRDAAPTGGRHVRVAMLGAGVQGRSHLAVIGDTLPGSHVTIFDRHPDRAAALAEEAAATAGIAASGTATTAREATSEADLVITAASFTAPANRQVLTTEWLTPDALVIAVDYATYVAASVARDAALFVVDEREQFVANVASGAFDGYPEPATTLGEAILHGTARPANGRVVVTHLGVGLADLILGDAIVRRAETLGLGTLLSG